MKNLLNKKDHIFVAGHNGMVGSAIVKALYRKGYCDEKMGGKLLTQSREELDLSCYSDVISWFKKNKPNIVVISAAKVGGIYANLKYPYSFISENLKIQQNLIEASWKNGTKRLLFLGSSCIYPKKPNLPIKEEELLSSYLEKTNEAYAIAKISGIKLCEAIRNQYNFDAISLMPSNLYGTGDNYHAKESHVIASLLRKFINAKRNNIDHVNCWGSGLPLREFLHVDDLGYACVKALEKWDPNSSFAPKDKFGNNLYYLNVGSSKEISIKELGELIARIINYKGQINWDKSKPDGTFRKVLDTTRINSIGWEPKITLEEGLKKTINEINQSLDKSNDRGKSLKNFFKN